MLVFTLHMHWLPAAQARLPDQGRAGELDSGAVPQPPQRVQKHVTGLLLSLPRTAVQLMSLDALLS